MEKLNLAVLASGNGTNAKALMEACRSGRLDASVQVVISNRSTAGVLSKAKDFDVRGVHISSVTCGDPELVDKAICEELLNQDVDLVLLSGYLKKLGPMVLETFQGRILNIHPSLLPAFGGQGMFGSNVHEAVLQAGVSETGVSIHLVDEHYDNGKVIAQSRVPVEPGDDVDTLSVRVLKVEHELYVDTVARIASGDIALY